MELAAKPVSQSGEVIKAKREGGAGPVVLSTTPELDLLLHVSRRGGLIGEVYSTRTLLASVRDWQRLHDLAVRHKLLPLLFWHLREHADLIPPPHYHTLEVRFRTNTATMLARTGELLGVVRQLRAQDVPCVPYKGPALAVEAYGGLSLRSAIDLDVLVRRSDIGKVRDVLRQRGYAPRHQLARSAEKLMERALYHEVFTRPDGTVFEVHWAFTDKHLGFTLDLDGMSDRLRTIKLAGEAVPALSKEDLLLALSVHGAKHQWSRLEWLASLASLLRTPPGPDWNVLFERSSELGSQRVLLLGLRLSAEVLDVPLPDHARSRAFGDRAVASLAEWSAKLIRASEQDLPLLDLPPKDVYYLKLADRLLDRLRFLLRRLTTPSQASTWTGTTIGGTYVPIHVLTKPLRMGRVMVPGFRWLTGWGRSRSRG